MSKKLGLSASLIDAAGFNDINDLFLPAETVLAKGGGFERGPKAGHKYWRRQRVVTSGKLKWKYYYDNEKDRAEWAEDRAKILKKKKKSLTRLERRRHKAAVETHGEGYSKEKFSADNPDIGAAKKALKDLTNEFVDEILNYKNPPKLLISDAAREMYMEAVASHYGSDGDPADPHGKKLHALRMVEHAYSALPASFTKFFDGDIKSILVGVAADSDIKRKKAAAYARYAGNGQTVIVTALDRMSMNGGGGGEDGNMYGMKGGAFGVECLVHEMAHAFHNRMGAYRSQDFDELQQRGWTGASWDDWLNFCNDECRKHKKIDHDGTKRGKKGKAGEIAVTGYGQENSYERWAEGFTACLLYPHQMAQKCPKQYDWFRENVFGAEVLHPRITDPDAVEKAKAAIADATTAEERKEARQALSKVEGLDEVGPKDPRFQWWNNSQPSEFQQALIADKEANPLPPFGGDFHRLDPPDEDAVGHQKNGRSTADRFYEMNHKGRTVYFRYGKDGSSKKFNNWEPHKEGGKATAPRLSEIKECYDERGNPVDPRLAYLHLVQDEMEDGQIVGMVKVKGKEYPVTTTDILEQMSGEADNLTNERVMKLIGAEGKRNFAKMLRAFSSPKMNDDMRKLQAAYTAFNAAADDSPEKAKSKALIDRLEAVLDSKDWDTNITSGKGGMPQTITMTPHEVSHREFKQRSGTFAYDRIAMAGQATLDELKKTRIGTKKHTALLDKLRKEQGGVAIENRRDPRSGRFVRGNVKLDSRGKPIFDRIKYVNDNPDGSQTIIEVKRDPSTGIMRIANPMWAELLTPNGEAIRSAADIEKYMRIAAAEQRRTWVSLRTDRQRVRTKSGKWKMAKAGDTDHHLHLEVEFDGRGQPRIIGDYWKSKLNKTDPRLDHLIKDDPLFSQFRDNARAVIEGEAIRMKPATQRPSYKDRSIRVGERTVLSVTGAEQRSKAAKDKEIVATLHRIIQGKLAGELPPKPRWDQMPEQFEELPSPAGGMTGLQKKEIDRELRSNVPNKKTRARIQLLKRSGDLPAWYTHDSLQKAWFAKHFTPALAHWKETAESERQKAYETQYIFRGDIKGGASGQLFYRSESMVNNDLRPPEAAVVPEGLTDNVLAYMHHEVDPRSGISVTKEVRLVPPTDGSYSLDSLAGLAGVTAKWSAPDLLGRRKLVSATVSVDQFHKLRSAIGGLSLTDSVNQALAERTEMLRVAARARTDESHVMELDEIDPKSLNEAWNVKLNPTLPNGKPFTLGSHQKQLLQKTIDNNGRVLAAHYMGTGKTVSALAAAQMMLRRPYRADAGDRVGADRQRFLEENPWDTTRLHPDNPKRVLVVAPLSTVEQWRQSASDFDDGCQVVGSGSTHIPIEAFESMEDGARSEIVVVGPEYFTLHADKLKACGFDGLIIDEVHMGIKNEDAERNRKVREWNDDMKMLMLLTGTPMTTSPSDFVEYIRLLSNGKVFGDMTKAKFLDEYCDYSPIPHELGETGKGPRVMIKPEKMAELSAILSQYMDVAGSKDVRGKTMPAIRIEENKHATMQGVQANLYNFYLAALGDNADLPALTMEELEKLSDEGVRKKAMAARAIVNCVGYRPGDSQLNIQIEVEDPKTGNVSKKDLETPNIGALMNKGRGKSTGKWRMISELEGGPQAALMYDTFCSEVFGLPYHMLAGKPIGYGIPVKGVKDPMKLPVTKAQFEEAKRRMRAAGWPKTIDNPDAGPLGIAFRGHGVNLLDQLRDQVLAGDTFAAKKLEALKEEIQTAMDIQRAYRVELAGLSGSSSIDPEGVLKAIAMQYGITLDRAQALLEVNPTPTVVQSSVRLTHSGQEIEMSASDSWISDPRGSLHLLYHPDDWDAEAKQPKSRGGFAQVKSGDTVQVKASVLKKLGIKPPPKPKAPQKSATDAVKAMYKEELDKWKAVTAAWQPPKLVYRGDEPTDKGVPLTIMSGVRAGETIFAPEESINKLVSSLFDVGERRRTDRPKADLAMVHQNAKADELQSHIERFHDGSGDGPDGKRQMVLFGNGILDSCRTMEAKLRQMGYRDVNECIKGSIMFDKDDPATQGDPPSPIGKYFVTYIGSTHTGNRELNSAIFQKTKDALDRDTTTSLFVHKTAQAAPSSSYRDPEGNKYSVDWQAYGGDIGQNYLPSGCEGIKMSQWTADQREIINAQFGITPPESFVSVPAGTGAERELYFYGKKFTAKERRELEAQFGKNPPLITSGDLLRAVTLVGDPNKLEGAEKRKAVDKIRKLKRAYTEIAMANAAEEPPLTQRQTSVFNNCEMIVASDAAQVGLNWGNSSEMVMYDSLGSPMAEAQRITRCARMLSAAVEEKLIGKRKMIQKTRPKRDLATGEIEMVNGKPAREGVTKLTTEGTQLVDTLRNQMEATGLSEEAKQDLDKKLRAALSDSSNREPVMVQATDDLGRPVFHSDGPFSELRRNESEIFGVTAREYDSGSVAGLKIGAAISSGSEIHGGKRVSLPQALASIKTTCFDAANALESTGRPKEAAKVRAVGMRCQAAAAMGGTAASTLLSDLRKEVIPRTNEYYVEFDDAKMNVPDPLAGTYSGEVTTEAVENKVRQWIDKQPETVKSAIMSAGFTKSEDAESATHDPAAVYLAIRAQEILTWIEDNRGSIGEDMRKQAGGGIITENEINNRLIDTLNPTDRAILKTKKYLVNVRKLSAGGHVGQKTEYTYSDDGKKTKARVYTGFEQEYPVSSERRTRATQRARMRSMEDIFTAVNSGVTFRPEGGFEEVGAKDIATLSVIPKAIAKALTVLKRAALVFDLDKLGGKLW